MQTLYCFPGLETGAPPLDFAKQEDMTNLMERYDIKHLMTGPKGNSEFCFPETSMFPEAKPRGTLRLEGKQNSLFPEGPVIKCFVIPPNSKYRV